MNKINNLQKLAKKIEKELKRRGATDSVLSSIKGQSHQIKFSNNQISINQTWDTTQMHIFLAINNKIAITSLKKFDQKTIDQTIKAAINLAKRSEPNTEFRGIARGPFKYQSINETNDSKIRNTDTIKIVQNVIEEAKSEGAERVSGLLELGESSGGIVTSSEIEKQESGTQIHLSIRALAKKDASGHMTQTSRIFNKFKYLEAAKEAGRIAKDSINPKQGGAGNFDIIFSPLAFANLLSLVAESASIFSVESGLSFLKGKMNKKIAADQVNLLDNPLEPNGIGSTSFDAEGHPTKNKFILQNGILKTFLHNTSTAKRYKTESTGNAGLISPTPLNIILEKGDWSKEEMIKETKRGLLVTNLWYTRFNNYATGEFSTIPRDGTFYIENGKIKYPIKGIRISSSLPFLLKNIHAIGKDSQQITSWETSVPTTTPHVLIKNVPVTKPKE